MRNLKLQYRRQVDTALPNAKFVLLDPNTSKNSDLLYLVDESKLYQFHIVSGALEQLAEVPGIVAAEYLALDNAVCLATELGEVLIVNPQTHVVNEGTYCDVGIECMAWSPDQEVVVFITKTRNVVVMTCTCDVIAEHPLSEQCSGEGQFINVGWGKKETQFQGTAGKAAAKQSNGFQPPESVQALPQQIEVSWRADGAYFAVSFVSEQLGRMFKTFDKEGQLLYTSEKVNELQPAIAWRPSGTWIAVPQRLPNKSTVALFEKNGLRHREIVLPFDIMQEPIVSLKWSPDSDILAIESSCATTGVQHLYLYTIGNYHWYLKQVLSFERGDVIAQYCWDNRIGEEKTLHVLLQSGNYLIYSWHFGIDKYASSGIVAVIDGKKLLLTDFRKTVVPPPMCNKELEVAAYINACTFNGNEQEQLQLCVLDAQQQLHIYKSNLTSNPLTFERTHTFAPAPCLQQQRVPLALSNLFWLNEQHLAAAVSSNSNNASKVLLLSLDCAQQPPVYKVHSSLQLAGTVCALTSGSTEKKHLYAQTVEGKIQQLVLRADGCLKIEQLHAQLEHPAKELQWFSSRNLQASGLVALTVNQCLYIDAQRIAADVTSFSLAGNYLAYTQLTALHFLRLADQRHVNERKIERGGKFVTTIANDCRIVLQMPRGNLEAISPRVLALELVAALLERQRYHDAFDMLRKQRINLNIICDHNMCAFVEQLNTFLDEITNPHWLNLFLSDLQNEDYTQTMYASNYKQGAQSYPEGYKVTEKVTYLCEQLCERMEQRDEPRFRLPIITAYVKLDKLEKALQLIWQDKRNNEAGSQAAEEALKYLLYLVDVNQLYNVALGTYDFGLVLFVAQKSQKDPREFLPFLNELKAYEPHYRHYKIDEHLKRYDKALHNIAQCGAPKFEEALAFVKRHTLYQRALKYYQAQPECYKEVCLAFADHLRANGKLADASLMYERGGNLTQALHSAKHVLDWRRVLVLARRDATQQVDSVALSLVPSLQEHDDYEAAFQLLKIYGHDFAAALQSLLKGKLFTRAIFETRMQPPAVAAVEPEADLIDTLILPELLSYRALLESNLQADQELFSGYKQRLLAVRAKKAQQQQLGNEEPDQVDIDECDLLSDTTSMRSSQYTSSSRGTGKTFRSSKNRRKHERKLLSLKPGNPFEDIALIDALHNLIMKLFNQQSHMRDTCQALLELRQDEAAAALQQRFKQLLTLLQRSLDEIWIPEMLTTQQFLTGPNIDYTLLQNEQRYGLINPQKRFKPQLNITDWEHEILR